jgi:hypothetical protein
MRKRTVVVFIVASLAILTLQYALRIAVASPGINIDGDVSDWDTVPALKFEDPVGDTQPWSKDPAIVGKGSTAEPSDMVEANDKCRDLKALYVYWDDNWIYIRLDVAQLYEGWSKVSQKCKDSQCATYPNVSAYHLYFNVPGAAISPQSGFAAAVEGSFGDYAWHFNVQFDAGKWDGYGAPFLQWPDWSGVGVSGSVGEFAVDLKNSAFEMKINRTFLESKLFGGSGKIEKLRILVGSIKLGEPTGAWGTWPHAFDPDDPGGPGEAVGGSDLADFMPNDAVTMPGGSVKGPLIEVDLTKAPGEKPAAPPEEKPAGPAFPMELVAAIVVVIIIVVVVAVLMLKRKKQKPAK